MNRGMDRRLANLERIAPPTRGEQDWGAPWISFRAVAEYCAKLRTSRSTAAGNAFAAVRDEQQHARLTAYAKLASFYGIRIMQPAVTRWTAPWRVRAAKASPP
jgi:hypothetical protein